MKTKLLLAVFFLMICSLASSRVKLPHEFSNDQCTICHTLEKAGSEISSSLTSKCLTCHTDLFENGYMHPVDLLPEKVIIPKDLPLDKSGKMTCNTCHDVHTNYETSFGGLSHFLRRVEKGKAFCDACHLNSLNLASGHQSMFRTAHTTAQFTQNHVGMNIDSMSAECISCHDGSVGSSVMVRAGDWQHNKDFIKFDQGGKHPIGMNYEQVRSRNKKAMLKPKSQVDKRVHFFNNGCIGCGSCHDPFSTNEKKLVVEVAHDALCLTCHEL